MDEPVQPEAPGSYAEQVSVSVADMAHVRERRARLQRELLRTGASAVVCLTLNIPGPIKRIALSDRVFTAGLIAASRAWTSIGAHVIRQSILDEPTGMEGLFAVDGDPRELKRLTIAIEDADDLGRIFDIDVIDESGVPLSRTELDQPARRCLLCDNQASVCARSRTHSVDELIERINQILHERFIVVPSRQIAQIASRALLYELSVTPKPGLIDRANSGSHSDMDFFTMIDSITALEPSFAQMAEAGCRWESDDMRGLFPGLRETGLEAERQMFAATSGVNTHKGAVFSMGLFCAAAGFLIRPNGYVPGRIFQMVAQICHGILNELRNLVPVGDLTHGELAYVDDGITGIRGESARGYPSVSKYALPLLRRLKDHQISDNDAGVVVLLALMSQVQDSNMIARSDADTWRGIRGNLRQQMAGFMGDGMTAQDESPEMIAHQVAQWVDYAARLDHDFIQRHLSPGGAADLLAVTFFVQQWEDAQL